MWAAMRLGVLTSLLLLLFVCAVRAQSVRPAVVEYATAGEGSFDVVNDSVTPLYISMEAKSFTIDTEGNAHFVPLSSAIHLQLSQTSMRLPPRTHRTVYYKASADSYPAWFCIYSNFAGAPRRNSMNVNLELPHTVYLLSKTRLEKNDIVFDHLHREDDTLLGTVHNQGGNMVRLQTLQLVDRNGKKRDEGGFPLLPGGTRDIRLSLRHDEQPERVRAKFAHVTVEGVLQ